MPSKVALEVYVSEEWDGDAILSFQIRKDQGEGFHKITMEAKGLGSSQNALVFLQDMVRIMEGSPEPKPDEQPKPKTARPFSPQPLAGDKR